MKKIVRDHTLWNSVDAETAYFLEDAADGVYHMNRADGNAVDVVVDGDVAYVGDRLATFNTRVADGVYRAEALAYVRAHANLTACPHAYDTDCIATAIAKIDAIYAAAPNAGALGENGQRPLNKTFRHCGNTYVTKYFHDGTIVGIEKIDGD